MNWYFAYGSNMNAVRLFEERLQPAMQLAPGPQATLTLHAAPSLSAGSQRRLMQ